MSSAVTLSNKLALFSSYFTLCIKGDLKALRMWPYNLCRPRAGF